MEVIIHPGLPMPGDVPLPKGYKIMTASQRWLDETLSILEGGWPDDILWTNGIELTNFREVATVNEPEASTTNE